jgi:hypothetical protein
MDGPCFHRAREAIGIAKNEDDAVVVRGFGEPLDAVLDSLFALVQSVIGRWKPAQAETARLMRTSESQKIVAMQRRVSTSVVSEALKSAQFREILRAESALEILLNRFAGLEEAAKPESGS